MYITVNDIRHVCVLTCISAAKRSIRWYQLLQPSRISASHLERNTEGSFSTVCQPSIRGSYIDKALRTDYPYRCYAHAFLTSILCFALYFFLSSVIRDVFSYAAIKRNVYYNLPIVKYYGVHICCCLRYHRFLAFNRGELMAPESDFSHRLPVSDYVCRFRVGLLLRCIASPFRTTSPYVE